MQQTFKIGVMASTRGSDLQGILEAQASGKLTQVEVAMVLTNKADAPVIERCHQHHLSCQFVDPTAFATREEFDRAVAAIFDKLGVELILLIGYMRILSPWFVQHFQSRIINVHPSLLPAFGGGMDLNVHQAILDAGVKVTGCTLHFVDEGTDSGPIIWQKAIPVEHDETVESLKDKVQQLEVEGFVAVLEAWAEGRIVINNNIVFLKDA